MSIEFTDQSGEHWLALCALAFAENNLERMVWLAGRRRALARHPAVLRALGLRLRDAAGNKAPMPQLARACLQYAANLGDAQACLELWHATLIQRRRHAFARAWPMLLRAADRGSLIAMRNILKLCRECEWRVLPGVLGYLDALVAQGDVLGLRCMAQVVEGGWLGVPADMPRAAALYRAAAEAGDGWAQYCLGTLYAYGMGVARSAEQAVYWYQQAAGQGVPAAQCNLGFSHEIGRSPLVQSMQQANLWYARAAQNGSADAQFNLAQSYRHAKALAQDHRIAQHWYVRAAQGGHAGAAHCAARNLEQGLGVAADAGQALHYYTLAARSGHQEARRACERLAWRVEGAVQVALRNEAAGRVSQDVCARLPCAQGELLVLADGAGGSAYGRETAEALLAACRQVLAEGLPPHFDWADWLVEADRQLEHTGPGGFCTAVLLWLSQGVVSGASVGDSQAWLLREADVFCLTALQAARPLLGSGRAAITGFGPCVLEGRLLVASDGLWVRVAQTRVAAMARQGDVGQAADALLAVARLPDGSLADDVALLVMAPG